VVVSAICRDEIKEGMVHTTLDSCPDRLIR